METRTETELEEIENALFSLLDDGSSDAAKEPLTATNGTAFISTHPLDEGTPVESFCILNFDLTEQSARSTDIPKTVTEFYISGPPGAHVEMIHFRIANTGGHRHGGRSTDPGAVGRLSPSRFLLGPSYPQAHAVRWDLPPTSGEIGVYARFSVGPPAGGIATVHHVTGLVPLVQTQTLKLKAPTSTHPSPYYVTDQMKVRIESVAKQFYLDTGLYTTCTDAALQYGGLFDYKANWRPPHITHNRGDRIDVRSKNQNAEQKEIFRRNCAQNGLYPDLEFPGLDNEHWHIKLL